MLKAKFGYRYPVPHDVKKINVSYTKRINAVKEELVTEDIDVVRTLYGTRLNVETISAIEFETSAGLDLDLPRDGLVLEFLMSEGAGSTLYDTSHQGNNGTIYGAVWDELPTGKKVLSFDGIDDYVSANPIAFDTNEITVIAWVYIAGDPSAIDTCFVSGRGDHAWVQFQIWDDTYKFRWGIGDINGTGHGVSSPHLPSLEWVMVAGTYDGNMLRQYKNAEIIAEKEIGAITIDTSSYPLTIGRERATGAAWMKGKIGLVAIYKRGLSESEIAEIYEITRVYFGV